jgi:hypothetical protein
VAAQPPWGGEFQVNSYTTGDQFYPAVSVYGAHEFVVAWLSYGSGGTDSDEGSVQMQRFSAALEPIEGQLQVNGYTTSFQRRPRLAPVGSGFVVVWASYGSYGDDTDDLSIQARLYDGGGSPLGGQFQVNSYITGYQMGPAVSADGAGGFVVAWHSYGSDGPDTFGLSIQARRFADDGTPLGDQFQVNGVKAGDQEDAAVGRDGLEGFVVAWRSAQANGPAQGSAILAQRYAADGSPTGGEFQVNSYTPGGQGHPAVSPLGEGFVVAWDSFGSSSTDTDEESIQARRFAADGVPLGSDFQVNVYTTDRQTEPAVGPDGADGFVVSWSSHGSQGTDNHYTSIQARRYASDGAPTGDQFQVNSTPGGFQLRPAVGSPGPGGFLVTWMSPASSEDDHGTWSIQGQAYADPLFADGFESGDTSAWTMTVP